MRTAELIEQAIDYIEEHLREPIELERIAEASMMSVPNLYRMFYAMTGHPVKEYIRKRRTSEAAFLLRQSELPANEIGYRLGFDAYQTFNKAFKRYTGLTPASYRGSEFIFSFERIRLLEQVSYLEEREVSERYSDVRVVRLSPQRGIGYLHVEESEEGIEVEAIRRFRDVLAACDIDMGKMKLWGWNVDRGEEEPKYGYRLVAIGDTERLGGIRSLRWSIFPAAYTLQPGSPRNQVPTSLPHGTDCLRNGSLEVRSSSAVTAFSKSTSNITAESYV